MGIAYLTSEEIRERRDSLLSHMGKPSWIVGRELRSGGIAARIREKHGAGAHILELGSSNGKVLESFLERGFTNLTGVDIDDYLRSDRVRPYLRLANLNSDPFPAPDLSVDAIVGFEIFEHLENPWHFVRECARVLRPGGSLIFSTPWGHTLWDKLRFFRRGSLINFHPKNNHITFLTRDVFSKAFGRDFVLRERIFDRGWIPFLRPKRWNRLLPPHPLWSLKVCYVMERKN